MAQSSGPDSQREMLSRVTARVREGNVVSGLLGPLDLVSLMAHDPHLVALQIDDAGSVAELQAAAARIDALVTELADGGLKVERIAHLAGALNQRLFARLWGLVAPADLVAHSCLLVMGSEGRSEQLIKTDQDNALLLRDGFEQHPQGAQSAARFNAALAGFGWPPCPGHIMLTNLLWRASETQFRDTLREWVYGSDAQGPMHLAIFFDAAAVAGDARLLDAAREHLDRILADSDAFVARFAAAADQFDEPQRWWTRLSTRGGAQPLDLKKLGTFPIVHGVRALSLMHHVRERGTAERLRRLVEARHLDADLGRDLQDALYCMMDLKLRHQLHQRAAGQAPDNLVQPSALGTMERDQLKSALAIVKRFRTLLRERLRLDAL